MSLDMDRYAARLAAQNFQPLNGKRDPFELLSTVDASSGRGDEKPGVGDGARGP